MSDLNGRKIHIIGIGGTGMSPIAEVLHEMGADVRGSDRTESEYTLRLRQAGVNVIIGQCGENIGDAEWIVRSSAVPDDNPEAAETLRRGLPFFKRSEFLDKMLHNRDVVAVAGTHGKSTTTGMIAFILKQCGKEPGFIIGSAARDLGTNASAGNGSAFVIEADEYDRMFMGLYPKVAVLTRVDYDHPDCYPTVDIYRETFREFLTHVRKDGTILLNGEDEGQRYLSETFPNVKRYGTSLKCDYRAENIELGVDGCYKFRFVCASGCSDVSLRLPGLHNVLNGTAAMAAAIENGCELQAAADALSHFSGIGRRFEVTRDPSGIVLVDDYAHHPVEIRATLRAAREKFTNRRIWAVWEPHTFNRTKELLRDFSWAFCDADELIILDIFRARNEQTDFTMDDLRAAMRQEHIHYAAGPREAGEILAGALETNDVMVMLSAGNGHLAGIFALDLRKANAMRERFESIGIPLREKVNLSKYSTALCGGEAEWFAEVTSEKQMIAIAAICRELGVHFRVFGGFSNVLIPDEGYQGLTIRYRGGEIRQNGNDLSVDAGVTMHNLAEYCEKHELSGLEWSYGLPGTLGGAICGNAGASGVDIDDVIKNVTCMDETGKVLTITPSELEPGYRTTAVKCGRKPWIVLSAEFTLTRGSEEAIKAAQKTAFEKRTSRHIHGGSLGCVFKNPQGDSAGRIIDACGLKGQSRGLARVSEIHGNFIVTQPGTRSKDYRDLALAVRQTVYEKTGILLEPEVEGIEK